ncbi:MAG TPA: methyl-accepting chemotaxis protein [Micropepsaceae bacterium]|nr:methyl-accepting chemotaxis protein [Micropepsaceae bacterium]
MAKRRTPGIGAHVARLLLAAFATIIVLGGAAASFIGFSASLEREFGNPADRLERLSQAFLWSEAAGIVALSLLSFVLFALAWYLRERLIAPLEKLRRSLLTSAAGIGDEPIWGLARRDEIGALARAAESLRLSLDRTPSRAVLTRVPETAERLMRSAERLEQQLVHLPQIAEQMRERVEEASLRAAKASHSAAEAAGLAREAVARIAPRETSEAVATLATIQKPLLDAIARFEARLNVSDGTSTRDDAAVSNLGLFLHANSEAEETFLSLPGPSDFSHATQRPVMEPVAIEAGAPVVIAADGSTVLEGLIGNLEALERFAGERKAIAEDEAVAFMAALIEAIDRLNSVADRICATADESAIRAAE